MSHATTDQLDETFILTKAEIRFYRAVAVIFIAFVLIEVLLRAAFNLFPAGIRAELSIVRRVPWLVHPMVPPAPGTIYGYPYSHVPYQVDRVTQFRVAPDLENHEVYWGDAYFHVNTVRVWEGHIAGFRSKPIGYPLNVMVFGDESTFCWTEFDDCWVTQFAERYGTWFNAGVPGTGTTGQFGLIEQIAPPTKPRLVVWAWYANDLRDSYRHDVSKSGTAPFYYYLPLVNPSPKPSGASAMFMSVRLIERALGLNNDPAYEMVNVGNRSIRIPSTSRPHPFSLSWAANRYGLYRAQELFDKARQFVRETFGAELLIVLIPSKEEAYAKALSARFGQDYIDSISAARRELIAYLESKGHRYIDALPALQAAVERGESVYYSVAEYLDPSGNRVLAQLVGEYIDRENLLSTP
ncbi:MAG: hypothetical protein CUN50_01725 [Candidatus Thermofonsia Clade 1 bacterium]|uniref:SGNH/GDSL hydrolase family protein n=1 Tax=Candidatus Thermofonsia Clade 1 bacterium TaxID=2364210 RepID=A0A2M8PZZ5_9CHLR|nr:MAG: hypothetical protein CUN50_01725 [Candidatus Thermofonsia Clade 1 bacterium]